MKSIRLIISMGILLLYTVNVFAQSIPDPSPKSTMTQKFGLGEVKLEYSRPSANGRTIWGSLVPYGQVWRTGANYPTFLTFTDTVWIEENKLLPGKYALYTIPDKEEWTIIISANTKLWGAYGYTNSADVIRVKVKPVKANFEETFTICFSDIEACEMSMNLHWGEVKVPVRFKVNITDRVIANLKEKFSNPDVDTGLYWKGAEFLRKQNTHLELALEWGLIAASSERNWMYAWTVAEIYAEMGNYNKAIQWGIKAREIGRKNAPYFTYEGSYTEQIEKWEKLMK